MSKLLLCFSFMTMKIIPKQFCSCKTAQYIEWHNTETKHLAVMEYNTFILACAHLEYSIIVTFLLFSKLCDSWRDSILICKFLVFTSWCHTEEVHCTMTEAFVDLPDFIVKQGKGHYSFDAFLIGAVWLQNYALSGSFLLQSNYEWQKKQFSIQKFPPRKRGKMFWLEKIFYFKYKCCFF